MAKSRITDGGLHIGTSGWQYDSWVGDFYPEGAATKELLQYYAGQFDTVELNNSFYQLPARKSVDAWMADTPKSFRFSVKASRYLTHMKKLKDAGEGLDNFFEAMAPLAGKLAVILFQLPPNWKVNPERLEAFLRRLPADYRYTFEFRDKSWFCEPVYELLRRYEAALCFYDLQKYASPKVITTDFVYMRLHGPTEQVYTGSYDGRTLAGYARTMLRWQREGKTVYCYLDNDDKACAPADARQLLGSLQRQSG